VQPSPQTMKKQKEADSELPEPRKNPYHDSERFRKLRLAEPQSMHNLKSIKAHNMPISSYTNWNESHFLKMMNLPELLHILDVLLWQQSAMTAHGGCGGFQNVNLSWVEMDIRIGFPSVPSIHRIFILFHACYIKFCRGAYMATGSGDSTVKWWDFAKECCAATFSDHTAVF